MCEGLPVLTCNPLVSSNQLTSKWGTVFQHALGQLT